MPKLCSTTNFQLLKDYKTLFIKKRSDNTKSLKAIIIHDRGNHWVVASTIHHSSENTNTVRVYDSIYATVDDETFDTIKKLFKAVTAETQIGMMKMQQQNGSKDCGLFAIAVSTALLNGLNPSQIIVCQGAMRRHLISTFEAESLTPFPTVLQVTM